MIVYSIDANNRIHKLGTKRLARRIETVRQISRRVEP